MINLSPLLEMFKQIPPEVGTFLLSMLPVTEIQVSLPFAIAVYKLPIMTALFWAYLGNVCVIPIIFVLFPPVFRLLEQHWKGLHRFLENHIRSLEKKYQHKYSTYGAIFLLLFVAIPTPGSGVWTASLLAVVLGINWRYAVPTILFGQVIAILIILSLTEGGLAFIR